MEGLETRGFEDGSNNSQLNIEVEDAAVLKNQKEDFLTPEQIEKIMEKAQDVNKEGTALHSIAQHQTSRDLGERYERFQRILKDGLLGTEGSGRAITKEDWKKEAIGKKKAFVFFNIIGLDIDSVERTEWAGRDTVAIIFDLAKFKELSEDYGDFIDKSMVPRTNVYGKNGVERIITKEVPVGSGRFEEIEVPGSDNGYALTFRVAPRFFKGIVFRIDRDRTEDELRVLYEKYLEIERQLKAAYGGRQIGRIESFEEYTSNPRIKRVVDDDPLVNQARVDDIVNKMREAYLGDEEKMLPVYDIHGNMWWPKHMTHEEVKKCSEERQ